MKTMIEVHFVVAGLAMGAAYIAGMLRMVLHYSDKKPLFDIKPMGGAMLNDEEREIVMRATRIAKEHNR